MKQIDPKFLERSRTAFLSNAPLALAEIRARIAAQATGTARRDMLSALDSLERLFGRPLSSIRSTPKVVRELLQAKCGLQLGVSAKRYANICSCVATAVRTYGERIPSITKRMPLTPAWTELLGLLGDKDKVWRSALRRLACYCSHMEIPPEGVDKTALLGFHAAVDAEDVVKHPRKILKSTIAYWNKSRRQVAGWPDFALSSPFRSEPFMRPLTAFPESFQADVARWVERVTDPDPFDPHAPARPLRSATVESRVKELLRFASALVARGELTIDQITELRVFFEVERFKSGMRHFLERNGDTSSLHIEGMANHLRHIAKFHCRVDEATLEAMTLICRRLDCGSGARMSERNRERLRQFDDPKNVTKLLVFPAEERTRALKFKNPQRAARCMERALAIDILIHCSLRIQNLRSINLKNDLRKSGDQYCLSIEGNKVKNGQALEFEFPVELSQALDEFVADYRPRIAGTENPYLFAGQGNKPRSANAMRASISDTLRKNAGIEMHPHLFRHAIAKIVVERDPSAYAAISRHLGHKSMDTTLGNYLGTETRAAARHINRLLNQALVDPQIREE